MTIGFVFNRLAKQALAHWLWACVLVCMPCIAWSQTAQSWQAIGPNITTVFSMARHPNNPGQLLAGTYFGGVYRSTNWGYSWAPVGAELSTRSVFALAFDTTAPERVYAGTYQDGVYLSVNGGLNWNKQSSGLSDLDIQALAVQPGNGQRVLAGTVNGGVFLSQDGALQWRASTGTAGLSIKTIVFDTNQPQTAYAGSIGHGVYKSTDGGLTWSEWNSGLSAKSITSLNFDPQGVLYASSDAGVFRLPAAGNTWMDVSYNLPKVTLSQVITHPTASGLVFVATPYGVYSNSNPLTSSTWYQWTSESARLVSIDPGGFVYHVAAQQGNLKLSWDFGKNWYRSDTGMQNTFVGAIAQLPSNLGPRVLAGTDLGVYAGDSSGWRAVLPLNEAVFDLKVKGSTVYAGTEFTGVWKSSDAGSTWSKSNAGIVPTRISTFSQQAQPTDVKEKRYLFTATASGLFRSANQGESWDNIHLPSVSVVRAVAADPVRSAIVYFGSKGSIWRSIDNGVTFSPSVAGLPDEDMIDIVHAPWDRVYAITNNGALYASSDNNANWYPSQVGCDSAPITSLVVHPLKNWVLYAGTSGGGVCKSESAGLQWVASSNGLSIPYVQSLWVEPSQGNWLLAGSVDRIYKSTDAGATWRSIQTGLTPGAVTSIKGDSNNLFALVAGKGLYRSQDAGETWAALNTSTLAAQSLNVWVDPANASRLLLGTETNGVMRSVDAGVQWSASNAGLGLFVRTLAIDPVTSDRLYAGSLSGGLFRSDDAGAQWRNVGLTDLNIFQVTSSAQRVWVGHSNGIKVSARGQDKFAEMGQRSPYVLSLLMDPSNSQRVLVGGVAGQIWLTEDGGATWSRVSSSLPSASVLAMGSCNGKIFAALDKAGVWQSTLTAPKAWVKISQTGLDNVQVLNLACDARSGFMYAASNQNGVLLSMNGGIDWLAANNGSSGQTGLVGTVVAAVMPSPQQAWQMWAGVRDGSVWRSNNAGLNWIRDDAGLPTNVGVRALKGLSDGGLLVATQQGLYRRLSTGTTWSNVSGSLPSGPLLSVWVHPTVANRWAVLADGKGVYETVDAGSNWRQLSGDEGFQSGHFMVGDATRLYLGTLGRGLMWRENTASSFSASQSAQYIPLAVTGISVSPQDDNVMLISTGGQGVLKTTDAGAHWTSSNEGMGQTFLLSLLRDPAQPETLYAAASNGGVFVSRNNGLTWQVNNSGLFNKNVTALALDTQVPAGLLAGTEGGGAFRNAAP